MSECTKTIWTDPQRPSHSFPFGGITSAVAAIPAVAAVAVVAAAAAAAAVAVAAIIVIVVVTASIMARILKSGCNANHAHGRDGARKRRINTRIAISAPPNHPALHLSPKGRVWSGTVSCHLMSCSEGRGVLVRLSKGGR